MSNISQHVIFSASVFTFQLLEGIVIEKTLLCKVAHGEYWIGQDFILHSKGQIHFKEQLPRVMPGTIYNQNVPNIIDPNRDECCVELRLPLRVTGSRFFNMVADVNYVRASLETTQ